MIFKIITCLDILEKPYQTQTQNLRAYAQYRKMFLFYFLDNLILS